MFNELSIPETRALTWLRKGTVVFVGAFLVIGAISTYRAWVQVRYLELRSSDRTLRVGSVVETDIVNSARTTIAVRLELLQGTRAETLDLSASEVTNSAFLILDHAAPHKESF